MNTNVEDIRARLNATRMAMDLQIPATAYAEELTVVCNDVAWLLDKVDTLETERGTWMRMLDDTGLEVPRG